MSAVAALWRHPIKAHGTEPLDRVTLTEGETLPGDRRWAVAHAASTVTGGAWAPCVNFSRGAKAGRLMAMRAVLSDDMRTVTLSHPDRPDLTITPDEDPPAFLDWVRPLMPESRAASARIVRARGPGYTDSDFASVSILSTASLAALSDAMGMPVEQERFRGNIWLDGCEPWAEFGWVGRTLRIGTAELAVRERITRCAATEVDTATGTRRGETLRTLATNWGHKDFGVYAIVTRSGSVAVGDRAEVL